MHSRFSRKDGRMLYRVVPKNGDKLSILGFGAMRLATKDGKIDEARATRQLHRAIDKGVNFVDSAWFYAMGESEPFLGRALAGGLREKVRLSTKLPSWSIQSREDMDRILNAQLERLNTDHIDYYLLHAMSGPNLENLSKFGVVDFLDQAKQSGRIVNAGFSFHGNLDDFKRIVDAYPWEVCLIQYNYIDVNNQAGMQGLRYAASKGLGVLIMEPLRGGTLGNPNPPPEVAALWKSADRLRSPVEWALRWVWNHPEVVTVLSGMNEETHIEENLAIADTACPDSLTPEELKLIERVAETYRGIMRVGCTGCGYCLPCPAGVLIPECFEIYNRHYEFGNGQQLALAYAAKVGGILYGSKGYASQCVQCEECLAKCPQQINIPECLEKIAQELENEDLKKMEAVARNMLTNVAP